jgi:glycosyltransferase involved in cell wall biosynthesis
LRTKPYQLIKHLVKDHQVDLFLPWSEPDGDADEWFTSMENLRVFTGHAAPHRGRQELSRLLGLLRGYPASVGKRQSRSASAVISSALAQGAYDVVHCEHLGASLYHSQMTHIPTVLSTNDAISLALATAADRCGIGPRQLYCKVNSFLMRRHEHRVLPRFTKVHVVSPEDREYLMQLAPEADVEVIPLPADSEWLCPVDFARPTNGRQTIFMNGNYAWPTIANGWDMFLRDALPTILRRNSDIDLHLVAKNHGPAVAKYGGMNGVIRWDDFVPDYVQALDEASIVVMPDAAGTGVKNRLVAALARGRACVCSPAAAAGLPLVPDKHFLLATTAEEFALQVVTLLENREMRRSLGLAARQYAESELSPEVIGRRWEDLYEKAIEQHRAPTQHTLQPNE